MFFKKKKKVKEDLKPLEDIVETKKVKEEDLTPWSETPPKELKLPKGSYPPRSVENLKDEVGDLPEENIEEEMDLDEALKDIEIEEAGYIESEGGSTENYKEKQPVESYEVSQMPHEDMQKIAESVSQGIKQELEMKMEKIEEEVFELKKLEEQIKGIVESIKSLEEKYKVVEEKTEETLKESEQDIKEIKSNVNFITEIMKNALPALIKEVRSLKKSE